MQTPDADKYREGDFIPWAPEVFCSCIPGHRVGIASGACVDCGLTEMEYEECGNRPCTRSE